jgi:hypothetical protein
MTKHDFEKYKAYQPGLIEIIILIIGLVAFIMLYIFLFININKIFNIFHYFVFGKNGDIIFSLHSSGIFMLSFTFVAIIILINVLNMPFLFFEEFNGAYFWFKIIITMPKYEHIITYEKYLFERKIMIIILIISIISSFPPIFIHLRINGDGLYFTEYLSYRESYYSFKNIESISVYFEVTERNELSISPKAIIKFGKHEQNIWEWEDDPEKIINGITLLIRNGVKINLSNKFDERIVYALNNKSTQKKRENILYVFKKLEERK